MKCSKCNASITKNDLFCPECGKKVVINVRKLSKIFCISYSLVIVVLLCLSIFSLFIGVQSVNKLNNSLNEWKISNDKIIDSFKDGVDEKELSDFQSNLNSLIQGIMNVQFYNSSNIIYTVSLIIFFLFNLVLLIFLFIKHYSSSSKKLIFAFILLFLIVLSLAVIFNLQETKKISNITEPNLEGKNPQESILILSNFTNEVYTGFEGLLISQKSYEFLEFSIVAISLICILAFLFVKRFEV